LLLNKTEFRVSGKLTKILCNVKLSYHTFERVNGEADRRFSIRPLNGKASIETGKVVDLEKIFRRDTRMNDYNPAEIKLSRAQKRAQREQVRTGELNLLNQIDSLRPAGGKVPWWHAAAALFGVTIKPEALPEATSAPMVENQQWGCSGHRKSRRVPARSFAS